MSLAIAVMIAVSAVRSSARRAGQPLAGGGPGEVGDDVHRVGGRAAVAERQQPAAGVEGGAQVGRGGAQGLEAVAERLLAQRADLLGLHRAPRRRRRRGRRRGRAPARPGTDRGSSTRRRRARAARCGPRAGRGARRRRARAPRARGRPSRRAPGARRGRRSAARAPTRRRAARRRSSGSRARARAPAPAPSCGPSAGSPKAMTMSSGSARRSSSRSTGAGLAGQPDGGQRALADDDRVHELDRDVARVRARRRRRADRDEPAVAREALGHAVAQARQRAPRRRRE